MSDYIKNLPRPICIVGLAKSGLSIKKLLITLGVSERDVVTFDSNEKLGEFSSFEELKKFTNPRTYIVSPGVPLDLDFLVEEKRAGKIITSEISVAASLITTEKVIGITGSIGKSTTTSLVGLICKHIDPNCFVGGNLGTPFSEYFIELQASRRKAAKWLVLELSSYQLENCKNLKLEFSAITYLSPNHLERYKGLQEYYDTKLNISKITHKQLFLNELGGDIQSQLAKITGTVPIKLVNPNQFNSFNWKSIKLIGSYNNQNIAMALAIANSINAENVESVITNFTGLPYRLQYIDQISGITYINDSKATAIESVLSALESVRELKNNSIHKDAKIHLLVGGRDKNLPWINLKPIAKFNDVNLILFGECGQKINSILETQFPYFNSMKDAVLNAKSIAHEGDFVLLSPGGSSLDEFSNFEIRGEVFNKLVRSPPDQ